MPMYGFFCLFLTKIITANKRVVLITSNTLSMILETNYTFSLAYDWPDVKINRCMILLLHCQVCQVLFFPDCETWQDNFINKWS